MKIFYVLSLCLILMLPASSYAQGAADIYQAPQFFTAIQDVPLMPGMQELEDQTLTFDKPEGRIIESVAVIKSAPQTAVQKFYQDTLPQLGWTRIAENSFIRDDEHLYMNFETMDRQNFLKIMVKPHAIQAN